MRIGYNTWSMAKVPYQVFVPGLHEIGYTAITISVVPHYTIGGVRTPNAGDLANWSKDDRRRIKQEVEARGLELSAIVGNQSMVGDETSEVQAALQRLRDAIDLCVEVAPRGQFIPTMNTTSGGHSNEFEQRKQQLVENLGSLADYAARMGVVVCVEPHVGGAIDTPQRADWLLKAIDSPSCRIDFDISHFEVQGIPMEESIPIVLPLSKSVEIKDQNFRYTDTGEDAPPGWRIEGNGIGRAIAPNGRPVEYQFLLAGEGDFDLPRYLRLMHESGWTGAVGFEASVQCQQRPNYDGMDAAASIYKWMADAWDRAGVPRE